MAAHRRYFILDDAVSASEIPKMMGRVVADKVVPMRCFAPFSQTPADMVTDIMSAPVEWSGRRDFYSQTTNWSVRAGLAELLSIDTGRSQTRSVDVKADTIKCYTLKNSMMAFERLMRVPTYAEDVRTLLKQSRRGHAYLVVGMLTAEGGLWKEFTTRSAKVGLEVKAPVLEATTGITLPGGIGNPEIKPEVEISQKIGREMKIGDEVIFALAYDVIRDSRSLDFEAKTFVKKTLNVGPKIAKANHLAFTEPGRKNRSLDDSDEEEEFEFSDDDHDNHSHAIGSSKEVITYINTERDVFDEESLGGHLEAFFDLRVDAM
jgi:hypothetical protein